MGAAELCVFLKICFDMFNLIQQYAEFRSTMVSADLKQQEQQLEEYDPICGVQRLGHPQGMQHCPRWHWRVDFRGQLNASLASCQDRTFIRIRSNSFNRSRGQRYDEEYATNRVTALHCKYTENSTK